jgi:hypothetical protein
MFHGVDIMQNRDMKIVARKMLIYFGDMPVMSCRTCQHTFVTLYSSEKLHTFEKGYVPAATWLPIVARMKAAETKNFAARESNFAITAGIYLNEGQLRYQFWDQRFYHSNSPHKYECASVTKIGVRAPRVPMIGRARNWWGPASLFLLKRPKSGMLTARELNNPMMTLRPVSAEYVVFM